MHFLKTMHEIRQSSDNGPIYYLDEIWVNEHYSRKYKWQVSTESNGLDVPLEEGI